MRSHPVPYHPQLSHPHPGKTPSSVGPGLPSRGLTLDEQVGGVHRLPLDAVCTAGVGASVLPTDRRHRQAALTHLEPRRRIQLPPWAPSTPSQVEGASGPVHWGTCKVTGTAQSACRLQPYLRLRKGELVGTHLFFSLLA